MWIRTVLKLLCGGVWRHSKMLTCLGHSRGSLIPSILCFHPVETRVYHRRMNATTSSRLFRGQSLNVQKSKNVDSKKNDLIVQWIDSVVGWHQIGSIGDKKCYENDTNDGRQSRAASHLWWRCLASNRPTHRCPEDQRRSGEFVAPIWSQSEAYCRFFAGSFWRLRLGRDWIPQTHHDFDAQFDPTIIDVIDGRCRSNRVDDARWRFLLSSSAWRWNYIRTLFAVYERATKFYVAISGRLLFIIPFAGFPTRRVSVLVLSRTDEIWKLFLFLFHF